MPRSRERSDAGGGKPVRQHGVAGDDDARGGVQVEHAPGDLARVALHAAGLGAQPLAVEQHGLPSAAGVRGAQGRSLPFRRVGREQALPCGEVALPGRLAPAQQLLGRVSHLLRRRDAGRRDRPGQRGDIARDDRHAELERLENRDREALPARGVQVHPRAAERAMRVEGRQPAGGRDAGALEALPCDPVVAVADPAGVQIRVAVAAQVQHGVPEEVGVLLRADPTRPRRRGRGRGARASPARALARRSGRGRPVAP